MKDKGQNLAFLGPCEDLGLCQPALVGGEFLKKRKRGSVIEQTNRITMSIMPPPP